MNHNPWYLELLAEYERDRIQRDIKQIRLEKAAMKANSIEKTTGTRRYRPRLLVRVMLTTIKWLISAGN